ncbi:hypothetical protein Tco_0474314 [Tanacetum coccineum]
MGEINIDDLTIEQYFKLTQENHAPSIGMKVDDMTIAEYLEYEETIKTQDYDGYQTYSNKAGDWFEVELEKCWKIQRKRDESYLNPRKQAQDDALRSWEAQIDQLRRQEHEVSECKMVHKPKNDTQQKDINQIERISRLPEKPNPGRVSKDKDDLEGIIDYLEPMLYDGFIDLDDEAYKEGTSY